jgi:hypothetical protein
LLCIPLDRSFDSLNVAVAAGIIQNEIFNQRYRGIKTKENQKSIGKHIYP